MKRKAWKIAVLALAGFVLLCVTGVGGVFAYIELRNRGWLRDALAEYDRGNWELAKGYFERYLPQEPRNAELLLKYADACQELTVDRAEALRGAATAYQQILAYHPDRVDVRVPLIDTYLRLEAWSTLEYCTRDWLRRAPEDADLIYYHALALDRMDKPDDAMKGYETLIAQRTDRADVYGNFARILRGKGLEQQAVDVFAAARAARPTDGRIVADYARFLARHATWAEVQALLDEALRLSPNDPGVLIAAAQADMLRRRHAHAAELLQSAIQAKPDDGAAYLMLASACVNQGKTDDAIEALRGVDPMVRADTPMILITLADLQLSVSAFDDAKTTIAEYAKVCPDQLPINEFFAAKELLVRGEASEAVQRLAPVAQLRPNFGPAQYALAEAYLATGEIELARHALESYLAKNAMDERAQRLMAQRFGRPASIEALAERAADLAKENGPAQERLLAAASALLESAVRHDALAKHRDLIVTTIEKAIASAPSVPGPYRVLAELALWENQPADALAAADRGVAQGCDAGEFAIVRAGAALAANDGAGAAKIVDDAAARPAFVHADYAEWAAFFAQHDWYAAALSMLDRGIERAGEGEAKASLEVERVVLAMRHGDLALASEQIERAGPRVAEGTALRRRLNAARLQLAQARLAVDLSPQAEHDARKWIDAVRAEDPGHAQLPVADGMLLLRSGAPERDQAQALFERAAAADPFDAGAQWGLAKAALARSDYPRALTYIERALALAPNVRALRLIEADALIETDRLFEAERVIQRLIAERPGDPAAAQMLVVCMLRRGANEDAAAAMAQFENLAANDAAYADAVRELRAALLTGSGNDIDAEQALRAEWAARPDDVGLATQLASVVFRQGRHDEAKSLLEDCAKRRGADPAVWVAIAKWWVGTDGETNWREASTCLTRAFSVDPDHVPAIRAMLAVRLRQRDDSEAIALCDRYLEKNPDDADTLNIKARLLGQTQGRQHEALAAAERAIELDDRAEYRATRGVVLVAMRQYERALRDLRPYVMESLDVPARIDAALAEAYLGTDEVRLARRHLDQAQAKSKSGDGTVAGRLDRLDEALRRKEAAA